MNECVKLNIPGTNQYIFQGCKVKLGRFHSQLWEVGLGWFDFDDNRPFWGFYLSNIQTGQVKPLLKTDLVDIYVIQ